MRKILAGERGFWIRARQLRKTFAVFRGCNSKSSFEFYKKKVKKPFFVHHQSAILKKAKINFIRNERKRIQDRCSTQTTKHQGAFDEILRLNGYSESCIHHTKQPQNRRREDSLPSSTEWSYLKIPYIPERLDHKITNIFRKEGIPIRIAHKPYTLRKALSHKIKGRTCTRDNCLIAHTKLCLLRNAVYQITCKNCNQHYIGSTTRFIHDRVKEHLTNGNSSINKHITICQNNDYKGTEVKIIVLENDPVNLRLFEAFYIRKNKPTLNFREECIEFADLLF